MSEPMTEPDIAARIDIEVKAQVAALLPELLKQFTVAAGAAPAGADPQRWMQDLALQIANLSGQQTGQKYIAPEVIAARDAARERCIDAVIAAKAGSEVPEYRLIDKVWLGERLIEPFQVDPQTKVASPTIIAFNGIPSDHMRPVNAPAKRIFDEYVQWIGSVVSGSRNRDPRDLAVLPNGLVVKGIGPGQRRNVTVDVDSDYDHLLSKRTSPNPHADEVAVLGTVAKKAVHTDTLDHIPAR